MNKYKAEQVEKYASYAAEHSQVMAAMLRDYAALLRERENRTDSAGYTLGPVSDGGMDPRERESAKAVVTDELAEGVLNRYVNECISHLDETPVHLRVTAMRVALEAFAPMLTKAAKVVTDEVVESAIRELYGEAFEYLTGESLIEEKRVTRRVLEAVAPMLASTQTALSQDQIERHQLEAGSCPPQSKVLLVSSIQRMLASARVPDAKETDWNNPPYDEGYVDGWNACRETMLAAAPKPEANNP